MYRRVTELGLLALFFGGQGALLYETRWLQNTFDLQVLLIVALLGTSMLTGLAYRYRWLRHTSVMHKWPLWILLYAATASLSFAAASAFNRLTAEPVSTSTWVVASKAHQRPRSKSPEQWKLLVTSSGESHWISVSAAEWGTALAGQPYTSSIYRGALGVRFAEPPSRH